MSDSSVLETVFDFPARSGASSVMHKGRWYVFGGYQSGYNSDLFEITLEILRLKKVNVDAGSKISEREYCGIAVIDTSLYVFGGRNRAGDFNDMYRIQLSLSPPAWEKMDYADEDEIPCPRSNFAFGVIDGKFIIFGGRYQDNYLSDTYEWDGRWRKIKVARSPSPRYGCSSATLASGLVIFGGCTGHIRGKYDSVNDLWIYRSDAWAQVEHFGVTPEPRFFHAGASCNGQSFVFFGGSTGTHVGYGARWAKNHLEGLNW